MFVEDIDKSDCCLVAAIRVLRRMALEVRGHDVEGTKSGEGANI